MAVSRQGTQDNLGAKSANWLAEWLAELPISFPISPSQAMKNPGTRTRPRPEAFLVELTKWRRTAAVVGAEIITHESKLICRE